jgi:hypothetical protein
MHNRQSAKEPKKKLSGLSVKDLPKQKVLSLCHRPGGPCA